METKLQEEAKEEQTVSVGRTVKKKFFAALAAGFILLGGLTAAFGLSGVAFAMPLGGMGDFYVEFNKLEGDGFTLLPHVGETGNSDAAPMVRNKIDNATVYGLHIYKDVKLPGTDNWVRVNIEASEPVKIKGLIQDARFVDANLNFKNLAVKEKNNDKLTNWMQSADHVTITDAKIVTDYLFQSMVALNGTEISVKDIDKPEKVSP